MIKHILVFVSQGLFSRTSSITTQTLTLIHVLIFSTGQGEFRPEHPESEPSSGTPGGWIEPWLPGVKTMSAANLQKPGNYVQMIYSCCRVQCLFFRQLRVRIEQQLSTSC